MAYSANSPAKKCRGKCRQVRPAPEYDGGPEDRICRSCREAFEEARKPPPPIPLGDGRTAITLLGKHARGRVAYVSDAKVPLITGYRWRVMEYIRADGVKCGPYAVSKAPGGAMLYMHTVVSGYQRTDHKDGDGLNNTDENLRDATQSQNGANRGKRRTGGTSIYKGVRQLPSGSWEARIKVNYEQDSIGCFPDEQDAARAYDAAALAAWGPFAYLNFPEVRDAG